MEKKKKEVKVQYSRRSTSMCIMYNVPVVYNIRGDIPPTQCKKRIDTKKKEEEK